MPNVVFHADIEDMSGKQSDQVYTKARSGPTRRSRVDGTNPNKPRQAQTRIVFGQVSKAYAALDLPTVQAWDEFASTLRWKNRKTGVGYVPTGNMVFGSLANKFLQVQPTGTIPVNPPTDGFSGDPFLVTATGGSGVVTFAAPQPNTDGTNTELLLQRLKRASRRPRRDGYNLRAFYDFSAGHLSVDLSQTPGLYACGYRFVNVLTGQSTNMVMLDIVTVV